MNVNLPVGRSNWAEKEFQSDLITAVGAGNYSFNPRPDAAKLELDNDLPFRNIYCYFGFSGAQPFELEGELIGSLLGETKLRIPVKVAANGSVLNSSIAQSFASLLYASQSAVGNDAVLLSLSPNSNLNPAWPQQVVLPPLYYTANIDKLRFDFFAGRAWLQNTDVVGWRVWLGCLSKDAR